jgi:pimeloyl-ACP methyl ester carboxylesterase
VARQLAALIAHGDRRPLLGQIACPVSVLHGKADPLIPFACGEDIARHIPQARLWPFDGMGHDLPRALTAQLVEAIAWAAR